MTAPRHADTDQLLAGSSLGADGMAELHRRTPTNRLAEIRRRTAVRDALDDLTVVLSHLTPLTRLHTRPILEDLHRALGDSQPSASGETSPVHDLDQARSHAETLASTASDRADLTFERARIVALDLAREVDQACTHAHARARSLAVDHAQAAARLNDVDRAFDLAHVLIGVRLRAVALADILLGSHPRLRAHNLAKAHITARVLAADLAHASALVRPQPHGAATAVAVLDRARVLFGELEADEHLNAVLGRVRGLLPAVLSDQDARRRLGNEICRVRDDFLVADLRHADLEGAWLEGVQWTTSTCWPAEWAERIERDSDEIGLGIYQVRGGNTRREPVLV